MPAPKETHVLQGFTALHNSVHNYPVSPAGLEPATFGFGGQRSIQLSYGDNRAIHAVLSMLSLLSVAQQGAAITVCNGLAS